MNFKEVADIVLGASQADETEIVYRRLDGSLTRFANNHIHQNVTETNHEILVRCVSGSRCGTAIRFGPEWQRASASSIARTCSRPSTTR